MMSMHTSGPSRRLRPKRSVVAVSLIVCHITLDVLQVDKAKATAQKIDVELKDLQATLANIEEARPFEDLTVGFTRFQWARI